MHSKTSITLRKKVDHQIKKKRNVGFPLNRKKTQLQRLDIPYTRGIQKVLRQILKNSYFISEIY